MSAEINDGGPAFPLCVPDYHGDRPHLQNGMSLRDWFAGQALAGILASQQEDGAFEYYGKDDGDLHEDWVPETAYRIADAMIAARKRAD